MDAARRALAWEAHDCCQGPDDCALQCVCGCCEHAASFRLLCVVLPMRQWSLRWSAGARGSHARGNTFCMQCLVCHCAVRCSLGLRLHPLTETPVRLCCALEAPLPLRLRCCSASGDCLRLAVPRVVTLRDGVWAVSSGPRQPRASAMAGVSLCCSPSGGWLAGATRGSCSCSGRCAP